MQILRYTRGFELQNFKSVPDVIMYKYTNNFDSLLTSTNIAKNNAS